MDLQMCLKRILKNNDFHILQIQINFEYICATNSYKQILSRASNQTNTQLHFIFKKESFSPLFGKRTHL